MATTQTTFDRAADLRTSIDQLRTWLNRVLRGKAEVIEHVLTCLLGRGHLLLEDRPGLGKTTLAKGLAATCGGRFARVQCTPDLLPSDITGFNIFNQKSHEFEFRRGPVFSDVLLADEINRATPRTQSALLEAMAERQVTLDTVCYRLSDEFFVIATQNPLDQHGTYPLPEAQLDRFAMKLSIGYPDREDELGLLQSSIGESDTADVTAQEPVLSLVELRHLQEQVAAVPISRPLLEYLTDLARFTRKHPHISLGVSPRGLLTWMRMAQGWAFLDGRDFVTPDDIQCVAIPVLSVRLGTDHDDPAPLIREILAEVPVPC